MMEQMQNGGVQYVPQIAVQYMYLDFDGELTSYNGEILTVDNVEVKDSSLTEERIAYIVAELNAKYAAQNVIFVTEKPQNIEYSTIYIGKTEAFAPYGNFAGLAETIDKGNQIKNDNAFVMLDSTASNETIISTISHETDHLLGTLDHGGEGLAAYAVSKTFSSGAHNSMLIISGDDITLIRSATTYSSIISSGGRLTLSSGGSADTVEIRNGGTLILGAGGKLYDGVISSGGSIYTASSGTYHIGALDIQDGAIVRVSGDARLSNLTVYSGGVLYLSSGVTSCSWLEVSSGGSVTVYSGAILSGAQLLESKARLRVSSGGSAIHTSLYTGTTVDVYQGGVVTDMRRMGRPSSPDDFCQINVRGGSLLNTMLFAIVADIYSGGFVSDARVMSGTLRVYNGGLANSITISKGGYAVFADYARGSKVTVQSGGHLNIYTTGTVISDLEVESGGILQGFLIGTAQNFSSVSGAEIKPFSNVSIKRSLMTVSSGNVSALGAVVSSAIIHISSGGKVRSLELANGAKCHIKSGGIVSSGEVKNSNTTVVVSSGGQMTGGTLADSATLAVSGGTIRNISATDWSEINLRSGATAENVTVWDDSKLTISAGASAFLPMIQAESGLIDVLGGMCVSALVNNGGGIFITSSGVASKTTLQGSGNGAVYNGRFIDTSVTNGTLYVNSGGNVINTSLGYHGKLVVYSKGTASNTYIDMGGTATIGGASEIYSSGRIIDTTIASSGSLIVSAGGSAVGTTVNSGGKLSVRGGTVKNATVNSGGSMYINTGGTFTGELTIADGGWVEGDNAIFDLDISDRSVGDNVLINSILSIVGSPEFLITVDTDQAYGVYKLASGAGNEDFTFTVRNQLGGTVGTVSTVDTVALTYAYTNYKVSNTAGEITLTVSDATLPGLSGDAAGVSWENLPGSHFVVDYSTNDYTNTLRVGVAGSSLDTYGLPGGTYQWQVKEVNGEFIAGDDIVSDNTSAPQRYVSDDDRQTDLFFARAHGVWDAGYAAEHQGRINMWNGTTERVSLAGKNKISDVFIASGDTNILVLTDDSNGDALFLDDVYTSFGKDAARIAHIDEIRAGAGDDIIDLTSQQFAYSGLGMKIYGGLGNDIIWGNTGSNKLFGNAGNDRIIGGTDNDEIIGGSGNDAMHGGGGNDVFCFGENWGNDTVEQLAGSSVTLWFENGSESNWNASTLTYSDGINSVKVSGVSDVTLKFGEAALPSGCFDEADSEKIFEDKNKGFLA